MDRPELLVPAGNLDKLKIGLQYGADAFYMGAPSFSMRSRITNFNKESLLEGVDLIRKAGKTCYITLNIYPRGNKIDAFKHHIGFIRDDIKPDAVIVADPGVFEIVKEYYPKAVLHVSVQANVLNYRAVKFWEDQGASRVILPRELTLQEIKVIHEKVPKMELEFFVHGAICMAYSGRCLLSNYMTGRDSNQGACAHSCRWKYKVHDEASMAEKQKEYYLEEEKRPGEFMQIEEDEHGTYIMNSKDMCMLPYLKELAESGVCSFKVEGRNKTEHYLSTVTKAYKQAIDDMYAGKPFNPELMDLVYRTANRGFIPGFFEGFPGDSTSIYYEKSSPDQTHMFLGVVKEVGCLNREDLYEVEIRNRFEAGGDVEVMTPDDQFVVKVDEIYKLDGEKVEVVHGGAGNHILKLTKGLPVGTILRTKC